jgi:hypothetical protein
VACLMGAMLYALHADLSQPSAPARDAMHHQASDTNRNQKNDKGSESESLWQKITNEPVAFTTLCLTAVTGVLAASTVGLWIVTARASARQSKDMRDSIAVAERAFVEVDRPWLFLESTKIVWADSPLPPGVPKGNAIGTGVYNDWFITLRFKNVGRMPAIVQECITKTEPKESLSSSPDYSNPAPLNIQRTIAPGDIAEARPIGTGNHTPTPLVFYGRLTYRELNGREHHIGFALEMSWYMPACSPYASDAYDYYD